MPALRKVAITGTPGTGKTTTASLLSRLTGIPVYHISNLVHALKGEYDTARKVYCIDTQALRALFAPKKEFILEGLTAHYVPCQLCVVLRTSPKVLEERLKGKGYSGRKLKENVEAERLAVIATEVVENPPASVVAQIDTTTKTPEEVARLILECMNTGKEVFESVDWLENPENRR